jgi:hypothetical protein
MKLAVSFAALLALAATPVLAQTAPAPAPAPTASAAAASRLNLDTPIETIVADPAGKQVIMTDLPPLLSNEHYDMFKSMSLNQLSGMAPDKLTPAILAKVGTDLAAVK